MRAVVYRDVEAVRVEDVEDPRVDEPADAVIRVRSSAICGSDLHFFHGKAPLSPGDVMGHEAVGVVEAVGSEVTAVAPGDRVVVAFTIICGRCWFCRRGETALCDRSRVLGAGIFGGDLPGAQAELLRVPDADHNLLPLPDDVEDESALFLGDALTTGFYAAEAAAIRPGDTVAVVGAGPVGFFAVQAAALHDPARVVAVDREPERLALAAKMGAEPLNASERNVESALSEMTDGRGADVVIEAVGSLAGFRSALDAVRRGGTVCVVGMYVSEVEEAQLGAWWTRSLRLVFTGLAPIQAWWGRALEALRGGHIDPRPLVSHVLPLEEAPRAYELMARREATKVVLRP